MTRTSKWLTARFVAWDGEGVTVQGRHRYLMLRNSDHGGVTATTRRGLTTAACLAALRAGFEAAPSAWHVGFAFGYDVNMIVGQLSRRLIHALHVGRWVQWRGYRLRYRRGKSLLVQWDDGGQWRGGTVWDTFGFFQSSFVHACERYDVGSPHVREAVQLMKAGRAAFRWADLTAIEQYCTSECELLVQLMDRLRGHLDAAGLRVTRWDGAGAVASALLRRERVKTQKGVAPDAVQDAAQSAFAGGRIELVRYGHAPATPIYHYDVNSAYPAALATVPCLAHGRWERRAPPHLAGFGLVRVRWRFPAGHRLYPLFWRAPDGRIFYPMCGEGWYWTPEIRAARAFFAAQRLGAWAELDGWTWVPACQHRPFGFVPALYDQRARWKHEGNGAEKAAKLGLNSLYGKCAQHVGGTVEGPPSWHQLEWAGYVTSWTRATLFRAAWRAGAGLIGLATDGVFTTVPLRLDTSDELGAWSAERHVGGTFVQSGVYWLDDVAPHRTTAFHRGFDPGSISREAVVAAWERGLASVPAVSTRFIGMGQALAGEARWHDWRQWKAAPRELHLTPLGTKRMVLSRTGLAPARGLVPTLPYDPRLEGLPLVSTPAALPWRPLPGVAPWAEELDAEEAIL